MSVNLRGHFPASAQPGVPASQQLPGGHRDRELGVGRISSRIGAKRTLIAGLVVFAGLAGTSDTVHQIVGFRAGRGLGNALFIATSRTVTACAAGCWVE